MFECHRSIAKFIEFYFFLLSWFDSKEFNHANSKPCCLFQRPGWPSFDYSHPNIFQLSFNFQEFVSTCKKRLFYHFVLEILLIKECYTLIGQEHFGPYIRNQIFFKYGICAGIQQFFINFLYRPNSEKT